MKRFKKPRNVTYKHVNDWANYWLPKLWNKKFGVIDLIVNIIPNDENYYTETNIYVDNNYQENFTKDNDVLSLIANNTWKEIAKWLFSISYHFGKTYKSYWSDLNSISIDICYESKTEELIIFIDLTLIKHIISEQKVTTDYFSNSFACDKMTTLKFKELL